MLILMNMSVKYLLSTGILGGYARYRPPAPRRALRMGNTSPSTSCKNMPLQDGKRRECIREKNKHAAMRNNICNDLLHAGKICFFKEKRHTPVGGGRGTRIPQNLSIVPPTWRIVGRQQSTLATKSTPPIVVPQNLGSPLVRLPLRFE